MCIIGNILRITESFLKEYHKSYKNLIFNELFFITNNVIFAMFGLSHFSPKKIQCTKGDNSIQIWVH